MKLATIKTDLITGKDYDVDMILQSDKTLRFVVTDSMKGSKLLDVEVCESELKRALKVIGDVK